MGTIIHSAKACGEFLIPYFYGETEEVVYLLCLDSKSKLIACRLLHRGTLSSVPISLRKAAEIAINTNAVAVILAHNHPGGFALPSDADYAATDMLKDALKPLGIELADHVIVSDDDYVSLRDNGYLR